MSIREVSVAIIKKSEGEKNSYLLVTSKKFIESHGELFYPPGGHAEVGESKEEAVVRELMEELEAKVCPLRLIATVGSDIEGQITHFIECELISQSIQPNSDEIGTCGFYTTYEIQRMNLWPETRKFFETYILSESKQ